MGRGQGKSGGGKLAGEGKGMGREGEAESRARTSFKENRVSDVTRLCRMGTAYINPLPLLDDE